MILEKLMFDLINSSTISLLVFTPIYKELVEKNKIVAGIRDLRKWKIDTKCKTIFWIWGQKL